MAQRRRGPVEPKAAWSHQETPEYSTRFSSPSEAIHGSRLATRLEIACSQFGSDDAAHARVMQLHADVFEECVKANNVAGFRDALIAAGFNPDNRSYYKTVAERTCAIIIMAKTEDDGT